MATLTIRNIPDRVKQTLRVRAAESGHSLEESLRQLLVAEASGPDRIASRIDAEEIMRRAAMLEFETPSDARYRYLTQKELSDAISGEFEGL